MSEKHFVEECQKLKKEGKGSDEILNWYRNYYYKEEPNTEREITAHALNDILPELVRLREKQTPKKPIVKDDTAFDGSLIDVVLCCPVCSRKICSEPADYIMASFLKEEYPHCHCGQALDWSETE